MQVIKITYALAKQFIVNKHYTRRMGMCSFAFGLLEDGQLTGVAIYGSPPVQIQKSAFKYSDFPIFELTRVVVQSKTKNAASFLVANSLKQLEPKPCAVVSYADTEQNHCGIIYQATNWTYTGATVSHDKMYLIDGVKTHPRTLCSRGITSPSQWSQENNIPAIPSKQKHRYFYFVGSRSDKKKMLSKLKYPVESIYPKCDQNRYDDGPLLDISINQLTQT